MYRFIYLFLFLLISLHSSESYPKSFAQLGTPLYSSVKQFSSFEDIKGLHQEIENFKKLTQESKCEGYLVDATQDKKAKVHYLHTLRKLQKSYDYVIHLFHRTINDAIDQDNYELFVRLTNHEIEGLLSKTNLKLKAIKYYKLHKGSQHSKLLDTKMKHDKLLEETDEFQNRVTEEFYDSKNKKSYAKNSIYIITKKRKNGLSIYFANRNIYDVTVAIEPRYRNVQEHLVSSRTIVVKAHSKTKYADLLFKKGGSSYGFRYRWIIGDKDAIHADNYIYDLPYAKGTSHRVSQGYNGKSTHKGRSEFSIDFAMKEGTKIYSARDGLVVKVKSDSNKHGFSKEFAKYGNFVTIAHTDGTYATYYHLKKNGVVVNVGDYIRKGWHIGYSGNTGYSSGPHLHFSVFKAVSAQNTHTIAVFMRSKEGIFKGPKRGAKYTAY